MQIVSDAGELRRLLMQDTPFIDVRAEAEFDKGRFAGSVNMPILNDAEREQVGRCYKQQGQQQAIILGHQLVCGELKRERIETWCRFARANPAAHVYCWRGGMRSNLAQQWMAEAGVEVPLVEGGYKRLRHVVLDEFEDCAQHDSLLVVGGKTGVAKTPLVKALPNALDLEALANHRGSTFGRLPGGSPSQGVFENALGVALMRLRSLLPGRELVVEDESRLIGPCSLPLPLWQKMCASPLVVIDMPLAFRIERVLQEYVVDMRELYLQHEGEPERAFEAYSRYLLESMQRLKKRLGLERLIALEQIMRQALSEQQRNGDCSLHREWIARLLSEYYDPMYEYQLDKQAERVVFTGSYQEVQHWLTKRT